MGMCWRFYSTVHINCLVKKKKKIIIISEAAVSIKISNLLICFCSFDLSCPLHENVI